MKKFSVKSIVAIGIGAALFFVLGRFVAIPSGIPNTNFCVQYAVLGMLATMYGPVAGALIGFIGHTLIDLSWGGSPWWSWVIASTVVGAVAGFVGQKIKLNEGVFGKKEIAIFAIGNVIANAIRKALEETPPELSSDISRLGLMLSGGGAMLHGLPEYISRTLGVRATLSAHPRDDVALGIAAILDGGNEMSRYVVSRPR